MITENYLVATVSVEIISLVLLTYKAIFTKLEVEL